MEQALNGATQLNDSIGASSNSWLDFRYTGKKQYLVDGLKVEVATSVA
jgi:hypothetical protein